MMLCIVRIKFDRIIEKSKDRIQSRKDANTKKFSCKTIDTKLGCKY